MNYTELLKKRRASLENYPQLMEKHACRITFGSRVEGDCGVKNTFFA